jgi:aldose 1-epimerase
MTIQQFSAPTRVAIAGSRSYTADSRIILRNNRQIVEVWPSVGGGIARYDYEKPDGQVVNLFRPAVVDNQGLLYPTDLSCYPLVPYSGRTKDGRFNFRGENYQLGKNFFEGHPHPLHGFGWQQAWDVVSHETTNSCTLELVHMPDMHWPFKCTAQQKIMLDPDELIIITSLRNDDKVSFPCGLGQHPHIMRPPGTVLRTKVIGMWENDATGIPTTLVAAEDRLTNRLLDHYPLDNCFTGFGIMPKEECLAEGLSLNTPISDTTFAAVKGCAIIQWPEDIAGVSSGLVITASEAMNYLVVYNPSANENFVCVEPVTHMPDSFNRDSAAQRDTGTQILRPNQTMRIEYRFRYFPDLSQLTLSL